LLLVSYCSVPELPGDSKSVIGHAVLFSPHFNKSILTLRHVQLR